VLAEDPGKWWTAMNVDKRGSKTKHLSAFLCVDAAAELLFSAAR
jgi:hypothetical protein